MGGSGGGWVKGGGREWLRLGVGLGCREAGGLKWVLFFQDTNGLLFKVSLCSVVHT